MQIIYLTENLVVFKDNVLLTPFTDYNITDTSLSQMTIKTKKWKNIDVGQKKKDIKTTIVIVPYNLQY